MKLFLILLLIAYFIYYLYKWVFSKKVYFSSKVDPNNLPIENKIPAIYRGYGGKNDKIRN